MVHGPPCHRDLGNGLIIHSCEKMQTEDKDNSANGASGEADKVTGVMTNKDQSHKEITNLTASLLSPKNVLTHIIRM